MNHDCPLSCTEVELATFPSDGFTISSEGCSEVNKPERNLVNLTFVSWTVKFFFSTSRLARLETLPSIQNLQRFVTTNKMLSCKDLINFRLNINFFFKSHTVAVDSWSIANNFVIDVYCRCLAILCQIAASSIAN